MPGPLRKVAKRAALAITLHRLVEEGHAETTKIEAVLGHRGAMTDLAGRVHLLARNEGFAITCGAMATEDDAESGLFRRVLEWLWQHREQIVSLLLTVAGIFLHI